MNNEHELNIDDQDIVPDEEVESPAAALKKLREKLKACEAEKQEYLTGWQRAKADFVNARKVDAHEREEFARFATEKVLLDMLGVADSFEMAFAHKESWEKVDAGWRTGVESIYSQLLTAFERHGLVPFGVPGERFDPRLHAAAHTVPVADSKDDDTVILVVQRGYRLHDKIVRPARVTVGEYKNKNAI